MAVFLCYCLAVFDFMFIPATGASTEINLNTVTPNTVWRMVQGRAFVLTCDRPGITLKEIEKVFGKPDTISSNRMRATYWYPGFIVREDEDSKEISMHIFRLERFVRKDRP
jgi:hypothetical protein